MQGRILFYLFSGFCISFPISVSLSQGFAGASILYVVIYSLYHKSWEVFRPTKVIFLLFLSLYATFFLSFLFHATNYGILQEIIKTLDKSELYDVWMCWIIVVSGYLYSLNKYKSKMKKVLLLSFILLVISGFISIFTYYRLSKFVMAGFQALPSERPQHFAGEVFGKLTYLPIGFMSTHLTYGGILSFLIPTGVYFLWRNLQRVLLPKKLFISQAKQFLLVFLLFILVIVSLLVSFYNQSRSVWLGLLFLLFLIFLKNTSFIGRIFKNRKSLLFLFSGLVVLLVIGSTIIQKNWLLERAFKESLKDNTTENQRYFIYRAGLEIIKENLFTGIGPGRYAIEHSKHSDEIIRKDEQLWYELYITPRSHSHHDLLHFVSIGGIIAGVIYVFIWLYLTSIFFEVKSQKQGLFASGIFVLLVAGGFQCYLLDDEVALPFFALCGIFASNQNSVFKDIKKIKYIIVTLLPIVLSISYILWKNRLEPKSVYQRKIKTENTKDLWKIRASIQKPYTIHKMAPVDFPKGYLIEGCLTHRFTQPIQPRTKDFSFNILIPDSFLNPPQKVRIEVYSRDSFDQDKYYRAHSSQRIKEFTFPIKAGTNRILLEGLLSRESSTEMPNHIYFRDFKFFFSDFKRQEEAEIPWIDFGDLCD